MAIFSALFWAVWNDVLPVLPDKPSFPKTWFGQGQRPIKESKEIKPFVIDFSDKVDIII